MVDGLLAELVCDAALLDVSPLKVSEDTDTLVSGEELAKVDGPPGEP